MWLSRVQEAYGDNLDITWRHFSLEQNAYTLRQGSEGNGDGDWKVWEQDDLTAGRSIVSQIASVAARRQGAREQDRFNLELLTARHGGEDRLPLNQKEAMVGIAEKAGLDVDRFKQTWTIPTWAQQLVTITRRPCPTESSERLPSCSRTKTSPS